MSVSLATALYEKNYQHFIENDKLSRWLKKIDKKFEFINEILIFFNNISDEGYLKSIKYLEELDYHKKVQILKSSDLKDSIIEKFRLGLYYPQSREYYYSVANFAQIIKTKCEYVMYICEDISLYEDCVDFIPDSIQLLKEKKDCIATTLNVCQVGEGEGWGNLKAGFSHDGITLEYDTDCSEFEEIRIKQKWNSNVQSTDKFWISDGFGDHVYFSSTEKLLSVNYNTEHSIPDSRFPHYSGESFDKRINKFMWNNQLYRYISKKYHYSHMGWPLYLKDK